MKLGIIGFEGAGKATLFQALTRQASPEKRGDALLGTVSVSDPRVDRLVRMYNPAKTTYAQVVYSLPAANNGNGKETALNLLRTCDGLLHVVRNFTNGSRPAPLTDLQKLEQELIFSDFVVVEKRIERIEGELKRGRSVNQAELDLLTRAKATLENDVLLRSVDELAAAPELKGFTLLSAKPMLYLFNNGDEDIDPPAGFETANGKTWVAIRGKLESELADIPPEELGDFMAEFGIECSALELVIRRSFELLGLVSFFTVGEDEVKAWTIRKGTSALDAAEEIHSDIKKGFIRAEVVAYDDLIQAGSHANARKAGAVRLEGKTYVVKDGDIINFRFNV